MMKDASGSYFELELPDRGSFIHDDDDLWVTKGNLVEAFSGANDAIGTLVLKFRTAEEL